MQKERSAKQDWKKFWVPGVIILLQLIFLCVLARGFFAKPINMVISSKEFSSWNDQPIKRDGNMIVLSDVSKKEAFEVWRAGGYQLRPGAYKVKVSYYSQMQKEAENGYVSEEKRKRKKQEQTMSSSVVGTMAFQTPEKLVGLKSPVIYFRDESNVAESRIYVSAFTDVDNLVVTVTDNHNGILKLGGIQITEITGYRYTRFFCFLLLFLFVDLFFFFLAEPILLKKHHAKALCAKIGLTKKETMVALFAIIVFASMPFLTDFIPRNPGQDLKFHLERIIALAASLKNGAFPARLEANVLNGYGYPFSIFYPDFFLYIPAMLYNLFLPLQTCYKIYVLLINTATCLISFYAFRSITKNERLGLLGSLLYTVSAYRLTNIYIREAVGEYTAMTFLPLILLGIWRIYKEEDKQKQSFKQYWPLAIGLSGIIECHVLTCEMTAGFLIVFALLYAKKTFQKYRFISLCKAAVLTVCLNLWYLLPFLDSCRMKVNCLNGAINYIQSEGTYLVQVLGFFANVSGDSYATDMRGEMPLTIGIAGTVGLGICIYFLLQKKKWHVVLDQFYWMEVSCLFAGVISIFLTTIYFPWDLISQKTGDAIPAILCVVQFPWRYLSLASLFVTAASVIVLLLVAKYCDQKYAKEMGLVLMGCCILYAFSFYTNFMNQANEVKIFSVDEVGDGNIGFQNEYLLEGTLRGPMNSSQLFTSNEEVCAKGYHQEGSAWVFDCKNSGKENAYVDLPLIGYNNYHAYQMSNKKELLLKCGPNNNRLRIYLPKAFHDKIVVCYKEPLIWRLSELVSLLCFLSVLLRFITLCYYKK